MSELTHRSALVVSLAICCLALAVSHLAPQPLAAAEPPTTASSQPTIQYRRIYVPADKIETWPRDGEKYIPVETRDFDSWVRSANEAAGQAARAAIDFAEYTATLDSGRLQGEGQWTITLRGDKPVLLPLGDMSLIVRNAHWQDAPQQPARIGMWGNNGHEPARFGIEVPRSRVLKFNWKIQSHATDDQVEIPWRAPTANSVRLVLDLPEGKQPRIDGGVVLESTPRPSDDRTPGKPLRRWVIALSPSPDAILRIMNSDRKIPPISTQIALRENANYHIGPRGLDMTVNWQLDRPAEQKRELSVAVPAGMQLTSFKADGRDLAWRMVRDTTSPTDTVLIDLPQTDAAKSVQITFNAWQPATLDAPWRLPRFRPEGVLWTAGKFEVSVAPDYELRRLEPKDCIETGVRLMNSETNTPETHTFTPYTPSGALELLLSRRQTSATIRAGSSLALADPDLSGRLITQWNLTAGATHQLTGKLAAGWIVEAVETSPADAMAEWFIDRHGEERRIEVQLSRAASASRNVSVIITARLQRFSLAEPISAETMRIVTWSNGRTAKHLLTFQSNEPYAVDAVGTMPAVARDTIDDNDRALLDQVTDGKVYDISNAAKDAGLHLTFRRGQYTSHVDLETICENNVLRHEYRVTAQPDASPIDRIIVYASAPLGDDVRWTEQPSNTPLAAERLIEDDAQRPRLPKEGEAWLLRFAKPTSRQIDVSGSFSTRLSKRVLVPLFYLPEASQQDGRVLVRSRDQNAIWLEASNLQSVPLPHEAQSSNDVSIPPRICAAYRYQPADLRDPARSPKLWTAPNSQKTSAVTARHIQLESYFWPDGSGTHSATYQLENRGATELKIALPSNTRLTSASLAGKPLDVAAPTDDDQPVTIHLPPLVRSTNVSFYFETVGPPLKAGSELTPPLVLSELPFLAGDWIIWLPEEYTATGTSLSNAAPDFNWRRRLFGLLGRPSGAQPFNPLRLAEGAAMIDGRADRTVVESRPESLQQQSQSTAAPATGWRRYDESFLANGPAPIVVMHPPATSAWAVVLLLVCLLCGRWLRRRQPEVFAFALAIAAAVALLLPAAYADLAAGAVLGLLLSLVADWPRRPISADEFAPQSRARTALATALAVAIIIGLTSHSAAEPATPVTSAHNTSSHTIYRVLIPTDAENRPSGTKLYLSEKFLRALIAAESGAASAEGQWLIRDAAYSGELSQKPDDADVAAGNWTMNFSIETLSRDTTVVLPLIQNEANWSSTAMLDGIPLPIKWRDGGRACAIEIAEPGQYALSVSCSPKTTNANGRNQIDLAIPPIRGSKVEVHAPEATTGLTVSNAFALPREAGAANILNAELDRAARLNIQWSRSEKPEAGKQGLNITELRWLDIKPSDTELTVKYVLEGGARRPDSLTIAYDNRWDLLANQQSVTNEPAAPANQQVIRVPIPPQTSDRQEIVLHWRLTDPLSLGNLRLPPVELSSMPTSTRWLAISTEPSRQCEIPDLTVTEGTANEFLAKWGESETEAEPQLVLSNLEPGAMPILAIHPRETESVEEEVTNIAAGLRALQVVYEAKIVPGNFGACQFELSAPESLSINEITVAEGDRQIPLRWSRSAKNRVSVFFSQEIANAYQLTVTGSMSLDASGQTNLPHISALATMAATQTVRLYRDDDVHVELEGDSTLPESKTETIEPPPQWAVRPLGVCHLDSSSATPAKLAVKPTRANLAGDTLTALSRENGVWSASYRCQFVVEDGDLDVLRLRIPHTWIGPYEVQSAIPVTTELKSIDEQNAILSIRFAATTTKGNSVDLRIRSPLKTSNGSGVSVPAIAPEFSSRGCCYLSVPQSADSQPLLWTEIGARPAAVSQKLLAGFAGAAPTLTLEVMNVTFQVGSRSQAIPEIAPQIRLADTAVVASDSGAQLIVTRLILAPRGLDVCTLQLPPGQNLLSVKLDGQPALLRPLDQTRWQLALNTSQLPQAIEIVSRSAAENRIGSRSELQRPALFADRKPIPAEVSLWSFADHTKSATRVIDDADEVTAVEQAALRFDRLVSIAEVAKSTAAELPPPDGYHWFAPWAKLLAAARSQTQQTTAAPSLQRVESQVSRTSEEQITLAAQRMDKWLEDCRKSLKGPVESQKQTASSTADDFSMASLLTTPGIDWTYYVAEGGNDRLEMQMRLASPTDAQVRIIGLLLIVGLLIATMWLMRLPAASDYLCRWPHALGILLGIAWWAWMWPSWLGIFIVVASLWLSLRFDWPGRSLRAEASTVLRSTRSI